MDRNFRSDVNKVIQKSVGGQDINITVDLENKYSLRVNEITWHFANPKYTH